MIPGQIFFAEGGTIFRYSQNLDFLCQSAGFYLLPQRIAKDRIQLLTDNNSVAIESPRIDRYAIRLPVKVDNTTFKLEFIVEETLNLDSASRVTKFNIPCLNRTDLIAAKLLAFFR